MNSKTRYYKNKTYIVEALLKSGTGGVKSKEIIFLKEWLKRSGQPRFYTQNIREEAWAESLTQLATLLDTDLTYSDTESETIKIIGKWM